MPLFLLDRDGVVVVNRPQNVKSAKDLQLIPGAAEAIARLSSAGYTVAICTNQSEVGRGAVSPQQLDEVHAALCEMMKREGGHIELIISSTTTSKSPRHKPAGGMLREVAAATGRRIVFFCAFGERSAMAVAAAKDAGIANTAHIAGGIDAWKKAGGPVLTG